LNEKFRNFPGINTGRWIANDEGDIISDLVRTSNAVQGIECGTANGFSACYIANALPSNGHVYTFDPFDRPKIWDSEDLIEELKTLKSKITYTQGYFDLEAPKILKSRPSKPLAFFIDGDHGYGPVKKDWLAIEPYLQEGDLIIFHDFGYAKIRRLWNEFIKDRLGISRAIEFDTARKMMAVFYKVDRFPVGDETKTPIVIKVESEMDWDTVKVKNIPEWKNSEKPWTAYPEHALLSSSETHLFYDAAKRLGSGNYANLGTFTGASAASFALGLKAVNADGVVYAVDDYMIDYLKGFPEKMIEHFKNLGIDQYLEVCKGTTDEWAEKLKHLKFKFVLIDAGHRYKDIKNDFELWSPLVEKNGELAIHDVEYLNIHKVIEEDVSKEWKLVKHIWRTKVFKRK
jgi:predicted O-methyltransferase YrrM